MTDPDLAHFVRLESAVWDALVAGDPAADAVLLADDFLGVYPTGFSARAEHVAPLHHGPTVADYALTEPRLVVVADDAVLLAYRAEYRRAGVGAAREVMYVSSLWSLRDRGWVNTFSQDTPAGSAVV